MGVIFAQVRRRRSLIPRFRSVRKGQKQRGEFVRNVRNIRLNLEKNKEANSFKMFGL